MQTEQLPLWRQLQGAIDAVEKVAQGRSGTDAIAALPADIRAAGQSLAFHVWRHLGLAQGLARGLAKRPPPSWPLAALHTGLALLQQEGAAPRYDAFTLVDQLVEAVKRRTASRHQAPFINACLRRYLREREALDIQAKTHPEAQWNFPLWWIRRVQKDHPTAWEQVLQASNAAAPMTLRVNTKHTTPDAYVAELAGVGVSAYRQGLSGVTLDKALPVQQLPGFADGRVSVQDAAAQRAAELVLAGFPNSRGTRILDACAAPGGKTGHLLEASDAQVWAVEFDARRAHRIAENLQRLQLQATVKIASVLELDAWWDGTPFDLVLLDAPCTASGIVRRHPDVRWLRRVSDVDALAATQRAMLTTLWPLVRPGGRLLYCTCSVFAAEGLAQQQAFLANNTNARLLPSPGHMLPCHAAVEGLVAHNGVIDHDGFFYALFEKTQD